MRERQIASTRIILLESSKHHRASPTQLELLLRRKSGNRRRGSRWDISRFFLWSLLVAICISAYDFNNRFSVDAFAGFESVVRTKNHRPYLSHFVRNRIAKRKIHSSKGKGSASIGFEPPFKTIFYASYTEEAEERSKAESLQEQDGVSTIDEREYVWIRDGADWMQPHEFSAGVSARDCKAVTTTVRNWCQDFVLALELCPWAKASLQTPGAMRFFLVPPVASFDAAVAAAATDDEDDELRQRQHMNRIVEEVAKRFQADILASTREQEEATALERSAIYFVVFLPEKSVPSSFSVAECFPDFIDWFTDLEDDWADDVDGDCLMDDVIVAPFHPDWEFGGDSPDEGEAEDEACLDYEKRSPFPLVTLVSTRVVDKAGEAVTLAIGEHNRHVLLGIQDQGDSKTTDKVSAVHAKPSHKNASVAELWWSAVYGPKGMETRPE